MSRGIAGPGTWPKVMLYGAAVCAALIFGRSATALWRSGGAAPGTPRNAEDGGGAAEHDDMRLAIGIGLIVAYGIAIGFIGMAWATMAFVAAWLVLGGLRRPLTVVLVSTVGTAAILYLFVKISLMPLDRGQGVFEQATIGLYRILGIY
jgi:putative tricarboxylic transport membrane protein